MDFFSGSTGPIPRVVLLDDVGLYWLLLNQPPQ